MPDKNEILLYLGIIFLAWWLVWSVRNYIQEKRNMPLSEENDQEREMMVRRSRKNDIKSWGLFILGFLILFMGTCSK